MKTTRATTAALLSVALLGIPQSPARATDPLPFCPNSFEREPVLLYEVTGGTLSGPIDRFLSLYSDGTARLSSYLGDGMGSSQLGGATPSEVDGLHAELVALGAMNLCDQEDLVSDVPLSTLTVFRRNQRPRSNTFSWFGGERGRRDPAAPRGVHRCALRRAAGRRQRLLGTTRTSRGARCTSSSVRTAAVRTSS